MSESSDGLSLQGTSQHPLQPHQSAQESSGQGGSLAREEKRDSTHGKTAAVSLPESDQDPTLYWCSHCDGVCQTSFCQKCKSSACVETVDKSSDTTPRSSEDQKIAAVPETKEKQRKYDEEKLLECFKCYLKPEAGFLSDPVLTESGETYERNHILEYINIRHSDPVTHKNLSENQLYDNRAIKQAVSAYKERKPLEECLKCRLTHEFFVDPVTLPDGHTYERNAYLELKKKNRLKDLNIQPHKEKRLYTNKAIRNAACVIAVFSQPQKQNIMNSDLKDLSRPTMELISVKSNHQDCVLVHFHVIIPCHLWEIEDTFEARIRSGHPILGHWKCDFLSLQVERVHGAFVQMGAKTQIPVACFETDIPYTYVVYSPRAAKVKTEQEYIYEVEISSWSRSGKVYRCLPKNLSQCNRMVTHRYDTTAYPSPEPSWTNYFYVNQPDNLSSEEMRQNCYRLYMQEIEEIICQEGNIAMQDLCNRMVDIFRCLYHQDMVFEKKHGHKTTVCRCITKELIRWSDNITSHLIASSRDNEVVSSFTMLMFIDMLSSHYQFLKAQFKSIVGKLILIMAGSGDGNDVQRNFIELERTIHTSSTTSNYKQECVRVLKMMLESHAVDSVIAWIRVISYYHFLRGAVVPYDKLTFDELWKNPRVLTPFQCSRFSDKCNEMIVQAQQLQALFNVDPLLIPLCYDIYPQGCIRNNIHPLHSVFWLTGKLLRRESVDIKKIPDFITDMKQTLSESYLSEHEATTYIRKSLELLDLLWNLKNLPFVTNGRCVALLTEAVSKSKDPSEQQCAAQKVSSYLHRWIISIMQSTDFGGKNFDCAKELEKWNSLNQLLPNNVWITNIVAGVLRERLVKVSATRKLKILCDHSNSPSNASKAVTCIVAESIPVILTEVTGRQVIHRMRESKVESKHIATAVDYAYKYHVQSLSSGTSLDDLLKWKLWSTLLDFYANDQAVSTPTITKACIGASAYIQKLAALVSSCSINIGVLKQLLGNEECFGDLVHVSNKIKPGKSQEDFMKDLRICEDMLAAYEEHKQQLLIAVSLLSELSAGTGVTVEGLCELEQLLKEDCVEAKCLSDICTYVSGAYVFLSFRHVEQLSPMLTTLRVMCRDHQNFLFSRKSKQIFAEVITHKQSLSFKYIVAHIWKPAFDYCIQIANTLLDRSMTLEDVSKHFDSYDRGQLHRYVHDLIRGVGLCLDDKEYYNPHDVDACISAIQNFKKALRCSKAAAVFLQLKDRLELHGDFGRAEVLQDIGISSQRHLKLSDINVDVVSAGDQLGSAAEDANIFCLKKLSECCDILLWIKSIVTDVADLQAFVNLALETGSCGEDQYNKDRMSNLRSIGSDFAPLIFNIQPNASFEELANELDCIWATLKSNPDLPQVLEACNGDLGWYKEVKNTQGNVEATSFGQLRNILNYGHFTIGVSKPEIHKQMCDIILLSMVEEEKQLPRSQYSLNELEDLESRLVLISGEDSQQREEVDSYIKMLTLVRHIAEALLSLQQSGKIKYIGWTLQFSCKCALNFLSSLSNLALFIKEELDLWKSEVEFARKQFYELNYYTTKQLLVLRNQIKEVMDDTDDPDSSVIAHALVLLQSVCSGVSKENIVEVIKNPDGPNEELLTSTADILQHCQFPSSTEGDTSSDVSTHFSLPYTSEESAPQASKFTDKKYQLYTRLVDYYGFDEFLAEKATTMFDDEDDAIEWCEDHLDDSTFIDQSETRNRADSLTVVGTSECMPDTNNATGDFHINGKIAPENYVKQTFIQQPLVIESYVFKIQEPNEDITNSYLSLEELGRFLSRVAICTGGQIYSRQRPFPRKSGLKIGVPNLIVTNEENVLKTVLSLYTEDKSLPLPTPEEVLVCSESTTAEEVILMWRRAIGDPGFKRLFCLVHPEKLSYSDVDRALQQLFELTKGEKGFRVVIVCSSIDESKSHVISKLHLYRRAYHRQGDMVLKEFLEKHITTTNRARSAKTTQLTASSVDKDLSTVRVVVSNRAGMGKSLYARRLSQKLGKIMSSDKPCLITIPIHGPDVTADEIISLLEQHHLDPYCKIYHFDVASNVVNKVANVLFCLLVLGGLCDSQGRVWRCHVSQLYCIEITLSAKQADIHGETSTLSLLNLLPKVCCVSPVQVWNRRSNNSSDIVFADKDELQSVAYQRVYQFLKKHDNLENLDDFVSQADSQGNLQEILQLICKYSGVSNPSWREIRHFVQFLNVQLSSAEKSPFLKYAVKGLKTFVVKFAIQMSKDFATSSLSGEIEAGEGLETNQTTLQQLQILDRHRWEERPHPYIFFNKDRESTTFVGFTVSDSGDLLNPLNKGELIERSIASRSLVESLRKEKFDIDHKTLSSDQLVRKLCLFLGIPERDNPDNSYVLTQDNFIKILGIQMRFRCGIPVVLMGETGCGKTRLIRFMCDLANTAAENASTLLILKVHGGTTREDIIQKVEKAKQLARENEKRGLDTVLFFDEANTTEAVGLIKEVLCDKLVQGQRITERINFVAACNPYRRHTDEMIKRLESAGLGYYVKGADTHQKLGEIPLRQLVYRVLELPPSLRPHVYDFGRLNDETEVEYTKKIVENQVCKLQELDSSFVTAIAIVLAGCQAYMRNKKDECSFVSLRDVERAMIVFEFFFRKLKAFDDLIRQRAEHQQQLDTSNTYGKVTRSLILALSVCYHARLQDRSNFEVTISSKFNPPLCLPGGAEQFRNEILWCQDVLLNEMKIPPNIARNAALRENVFMMTICIELRIPLFLVGKPGSSKSLAKTIVSSSLTGRSSKSELLQNFKQVHMFSFQCSKYSTPESIVQVFETAKSFQKKQATEKYVSVVVLDEVGLAEDSPALPLKALHPLLEDGTKGGDEIVEREKRVAFVGISNWALDPAKMNRGVMVTRGDPTTDDLVESAIGICHTKEKVEDPTLDMLQKYFKPLADCYEEICAQINKTREFYGLRDFYCLIKMLYWLCENSGTLNSQQVEHAIKRNFGGAQDMDPWEIFTQCLTKRSIHIPPTPDLLDDDHLQMYTSPDCSPHGLIYSSLLLNSKTGPRKWEDRYLLFLTENYTALQTIYHFLSNVRSHGASTMEEPYILFGSSFPKDKEYTQTCRNINQIKLCMETGRIVILLNLENLYESLYDALNQYYLVHGGKRYVDLGLQTHRMKCQVHPDFRLILIAESQTVYDKFPTPLINRLEKHFVLSKTLLEGWQKKILKKLEAWIAAFVSLKDVSEVGKAVEICDKFEPSDVFVGFKEDTPAAIVMQATQNMEQSAKGLASGLVKQFESSIREKHVFAESKHLLLKICTPDALTRLKFTSLPESEQSELNSVYYEQQCHHSIDDLLLQLFTTADSLTDGLLIQVTTHSHLLDPHQKKKLEFSLSSSLMDSNWKVHDFLLQEFDTEEDFVEKAKYAFDDGIENTLLLIQCDSGHLCGDLIACARYRLYDLRVKAIENHCTTTHVLLIVHLPKKTPSSSFVGFQGSPWICYHLDELQAHDDDMFSTQDALQKPISELFYAGVFDSEFIFPDPSNNVDEDLSASGSEIGKNSPYQCRRLHNCIQAAASKLQDTQDNSERATKRIETLLQIIPKSALAETPLNDCTFHGALVWRIKRLLVMYEEKQESIIKWFDKKALSMKKLQQSGTFRKSLGREIEEMLIMFLAGVIAAVDRHCNLDLVACFGTPSEKVLYKLWINIFLNGQVCPLDFEQIVSEQLPDVGSYSEVNFHCKLPFSWIIRNAVASSIEFSTEVKPPIELLNDMCVKLQGSFLGQLLLNADPYDEASLESLYLHDFVRSTYRCTRRKKDLSEMELELCQAALDGVCKELLKSANGSLLECIAAIHIQYENYETQLSWFGETVSNCPGLLKDLMSTKDQIGESSHMILPVYAVNQALLHLIDDLDTALGDGKQEKLISWQKKAQNLRETTDSVLDWYHHKDEISTVARHHWQQVCALQMLIENVISKNDSLIQYARRLISPLRKKDANLSKESTFTRVISLLGKLSTVLQKKNLERSLTQGVTLFFMELISNMCFGDSPPEEPVVDAVVKIALSPSSTEFAVDDDTTSALCVFLLQQLLKYEYQQAAENAQKIFCQAEIKSHLSEFQLQLHCVLGYENVLFRKISPTEAISGQISMVKELIVADHYVQALSKADSILGMAELRCSLNQFAHVLQTLSVCDSSETSSSAEFLDLIDAIQKLNETVSLNTFQNLGTVTTFLLRTITRKYGYSSLITINGMQEILNSKVLLPSVYRFDDKLIDPFVVHEPHYSEMRDIVDEAVYTARGQINKGTLTLTQSNAVPFMLVLYEKVTLASIDDKQYINEAKDGLLNFVLSESCEQLPDLVRSTAEKLVKNELGHHLNVKLDASPSQKLLSALILHAASVFMCMKEKTPLVGLFVRLLKPSSEVNKSYLPTMPDLFECSKEHKFSHPFKKAVECTDMHCEIAAAHSEETKYCSRQGYLLGPAQASCQIPFGLRSLQPASCHIIRTLMHAALYWASGEIEKTQMVSNLLQLDVKADLPQFCWDHLKHDLNCLCKAIGRSIDEAALLVHMILKDMYSKPFQGKDKPDNTLSTPHERIKWEEKFDDMYLKPVLQGLEDKLQASIHMNPKKEHDELYLAIYEKLPDMSKEMQWSYYPQLTIDQLTHVIYQENVIPFSNMPSALRLFLEQEPLLRATQYLPAIVKLQQYMHEKFHCRVTVEEVQDSVKDFFDQIHRTSPQFSQELRELFEAVETAWNLVKETLRHHVTYCLPVKEEGLPVCLDEDISIEFLIPTAKGPGFCTTALVKFLVCLHNSFIQECNELVALSWKQTMSSGSKKRKAHQPRSHQRGRTVKLSDIQPCNLLCYEHDIIPVVLLHCYQTRPFVWHFHNLPALEKHILHKFVQGKPIIMEEIPLVTFKQEMSSKLANDIANIRLNVRQKELPLKIKQDILTELDEVQKLHQMFEDIEIALHFLGTSGKKVKPSDTLREYLENILNMKRRPFSSKVKQHCNLEHILSLWRTLGKDLAKHHLRTGQEPFDSVPAEFSLEFKPAVKEEFDKVMASIDGDEFLSILYEVIMTEINNLKVVLPQDEEQSKSESLVKHLTEYIHQNHLLQIDKLSEEFPEDIKIQQAVGVWKYVAKRC